MKQYLLSVICAAMVCSIVGSIVDKKGAAGAVMKLVCGIFLIFTVIGPISELELEELRIFTGDIREEAAAAAVMGQSVTQDSMAAIIKAETEAYILDKATGLNARITAEVTLDDNLQPRSVTMSGKVSQATKGKLEEIISSDLGIPKEDQLWID